MSWQEPLYYATVRNKGFSKEYWDKIYPTLPSGGKFWLDLTEYFSQNWFIARRGEWSMPWRGAIVPGFEMPAYDPNFSLSFADVTDRRALDIRDLIRDQGAQVAVFYSGGIDSTICLAALIRNLSPEELAHVHVCLSVDSVMENPTFFQKFILNRMNVLDSSKLRYDDLIARGYYTITADQGDCMFGTEAATQLYYSQANLLERISPSSRRVMQAALERGGAAELPFHDFADLICLHFSVPRNPDFGRLFYERMLKNIATSDVPVHSLHDFFWWVIFNVKYMHCALRCVISYYGGEDREHALQKKIINWFNHPNYQRWSMVNNNNGEKIRGTSATSYKWAGRQYIYSVDKNEWYMRHKLKLMSLGNIIKRNAFILDNLTVFGMDHEYRLIRSTDPGVMEKATNSLRAFSLDSSGA